jgi:sugar O-acyltransferase (sialic acid O-acetyltransferase NeuD family)
MENPVMILGAGGLGKLALEIFTSNDILVYGFLDDDPKLHNTEINGVTVLGNTDDDGFLKLIGKKCEAFVAVDDMKLRETLSDLLMERRKTMPVNAFHNRSYISKTATLGHGNLFGADVLINTGAKVGSHCIFHSKAVVEYEAEVGDLVQIGAGSIIGAGVTIGENVFIGSGVTIVAGVTVGKNARIGAGSVVIENVPAKATVFGNPAKGIGK